jgi:hypothetical protein
MTNLKNHAQISGATFGAGAAGFLLLLKTLSTILEYDKLLFKKKKKPLSKAVQQKHTAAINLDETKLIDNIVLRSRNPAGNNRCVQYCTVR